MVRGFGGWVWEWRDFVVHSEVFGLGSERDVCNVEIDTTQMISRFSD